MHERSFEDYWLSTVLPGTPPDLVEHWRSYVLSGVRRGVDIVRTLAPHLDMPAATVLDLGCGYGGTCIALAQSGASVIGVDLDEVRVRGARILAGQQHPLLSISFEQASAEELPFSDAAFDLVVCADLLEHVEHQNFVVREISRVLRRGGLAYVSFPSLLSPHNLISDPHYRLFGVSLFPRSIGAWYIMRLRKRSRSYAVGRFPITTAVKRSFGRHAIEVVWQNPVLRRSLGPLTPLVRLLRDNSYPKVEWVMRRA